MVGIGRLSHNTLVRTLSGAYVDLIRNVPLLLQLFIWYFVLTEKLPPIEEALQPLRLRTPVRAGHTDVVDTRERDHLVVRAPARVGEPVWYGSGRKRRK
jgi:ABC-type amino acid transport system permease subunit